MLDLLIQYAFFLLKSLTVLGIILTSVAGVLILIARQQQPEIKQGHIEITCLSDELDDYKETLLEVTLPEADYKAHQKSEKKKAKEKRKEIKHTEVPEEFSRIFVLKFEGDLEASAVDNLRECISALLTVATEQDQVLVVLESAGGYVHSYGLAASQLERIKAHGIPLTVAIDRMAASGGYLMACVADTILAAPFAIIGSIGVMAELPNFHRLMDRFNVDYELHTAGKYKRTLSMFGENTSDRRQKFIEELEDVHALFKKHVLSYRTCDIERVSTGEHWHGQQALELGLVDELQTSDDFLLAHYLEGSTKIYQVDFVIPQSWIDKLNASFSLLAAKLVHQLLARTRLQHYPKA